MYFANCFFLVLFCVHEAITSTPVVLWHGVGSDHLGSIKQIIKDNVNEDIYIKSIQLGMNAIEDTENGILIHPNDQISEVCYEIMQDENLKSGFHAIGFSQGSQFLRGLIQRCAGAKVINFISLGGQHQGIFGIPICPEKSYTICKFYRLVLNAFAYTRWAQKHIAQATYWHDPLHEEKYRQKSTFLADINNELRINESYKKRLNSLRKFVLVKFLRDKIVTPIETSWFGFYEKGSDKKVLSLFESSLYTSDKLGLKQMMEEGKLVFLKVDDEHVSFDDEWFKEEIVVPYLM